MARFALVLSMALVGLAACKGDASLKKDLVGRWEEQPKAEATVWATYTFASDGTCTQEQHERSTSKEARLPGALPAMRTCTWDVKNGALVRVFADKAPLTRTDPIEIRDGKLFVRVDDRTEEEYRRK